ncbi:MAG: FAD-binding oxidoreductase [candidate division KSB1 bacterium]|nr:FAD-binding oxidoreductase [candidate division KSB1 bacterium]
MHRNFDVIIIGAGVIGCSLAYHLGKLGLVKTLLVEKEEFPGTGSTSKANGGIRAQFTTEMNIRMSLLSMRLLEEMDEEMRSQSGYTKAGYLFMTAEPKRLRQMENNVRFQQQLGVAVELLTQKEIAARVPFVKTEDLAGGTFGSRDGFIDPNGLTNAFFTRALATRTQFLNRTTVTALVREGNRVRGIKTNGETFFAEFVVNCAGPEAKLIAEMAGVNLPVEPIRRQIAVTGPTEAVPRVIPMTIDADTGLLIRREGEAVSLAYSIPDEPPGLNLRFDPEFIEVIAPKMLKRFPILEPAGFNFSRCWAGCYEVTPDHHAILGESGVPGFLLCNGFSGHGIMHSPAAGLALADLIIKGRSESIDIAPLSLRRFAEGKLLHEGAVL